MIMIKGEKRELLDNSILREKETSLLESLIIRIGLSLYLTIKQEMLKLKAWVEKGFLFVRDWWSEVSEGSKSYNRFYKFCQEERDKCVY